MKLICLLFFTEDRRSTTCKETGYTFLRSIVGSNSHNSKTPLRCCSKFCAEITFKWELNSKQFVGERERESEKVCEKTMDSLSLEVLLFQRNLKIYQRLHSPLRTICKNVRGPFLFQWRCGWCKSVVSNFWSKISHFYGIILTPDSYQSSCFVAKRSECSDSVDAVNYVLWAVTFVC